LKNRRYFFTADEHYGHKTKFGSDVFRPYPKIEDMDNYLIACHNAVVKNEDTVIHAGDFAWCDTREEVKARYVSRLNGTHIFLRGNHEGWLEQDSCVPSIWECRIEGVEIVVCHFAMRVWKGSHHNSWQLYGHSHGRLEPIGKQWDIGVDNNDYYPVSFERLKDIMKERPDNPDLAWGCI